MIDLHTHTFLSDGALVPSEHLRRVQVLGYDAIAITDHADSSNIDFVVPRAVQAANDLNPYSRTRLIPGVELTHVPPELIANLTARARELGALLVVVHGETPVEPVIPGTNLAALEAGVELLAHPGFISEKEVEMAAARGIFLELTGRIGHSLTNGYVAQLAVKHGALLTVNSDAHEPSDFLPAEMAEKIALGAGLNTERYQQIRTDMSDFVKRL